MRVFPVIDLMHGQVVHGIAGRRRGYQPIRSSLSAATNPLAIAEAFRDHFGLNFLYLADLDAISGAAPALATYIALQKAGFHLLVDAGLRTPTDAQPLLDAGVAGVVAGLETLAGPHMLTALVASVGPERLVFSLDLKERRPLGAAAWPARDAIAIANHAIGLGVRRLLVLDLARVGRGGGTGTEDICRQLKKAWPDVEVLAGGGVSGSEDLRRLRLCGVDGVLVASALHDGRLRREDLS
jgi:phosphoribosylformimino-5-aminoimidazole carboxamide ribotide isomerase